MSKYSFFYALFLGFISLSAQDGGSSAGSFSSGESSSGNNSSGSGSSGNIGLIVGENYILKPSDVVKVEIYKERDLDKTVRIEGDGTIDLSLVGKVKVANMTLSDAKDLITELYNRDYLVDPQISVLVVSFSPKIIRVLGAVNAPGVVELPPDRDLTLTEAMASVRGVSRLGNPKNILIKRIDENGRPRQIEVNFKDILTQPDSKDILLQEGDTIWVSERII